MKGNCCFSTRVGKRQFFKLLQKFNRDIMSESEPTCLHDWRTANLIMTAAKQRKAPKARVMI